ncbi:MAG TPA: hypothetical protein VFH80_32745 [Solirubrobacteraceae bacterium]|nr:hypothetical protein [Solirubrobacteraceae bacterium]
MSTFEDRLWSELVREHGHQMQSATISVRPHRRRPALITGTALATAVAAAAVLVFTATSSTPAYAVTPHSDGTVTVTLNDVKAIAALNAELARDGIAARAIPLTADCPVHGFPNPMPAGTNPSTYTITIVPSQIPAGYTAVVAVGENASGQIALAQGAFRSPVPVCFNSTPMVLHPIDAGNVPPAVKAAIHRARAALARAKR